MNTRTGRQRWLRSLGMGMEMLIKISLKGLANYMAAGSAPGRTILRNFKYPKPEGAAQAKYYGPARAAIATFHGARHPHEWLEQQARRLTAEAANAPNTGVATKLRSNARAIMEYARTPWSREAATVVPDPALALQYGNVRVTAMPDVTLKIGDRTVIMKFDFSPKEPEKIVIAVMTQGLHEAAIAAGTGVSPGDVIYLDVRRGKEHRGERSRTRLTNNIRATCENIEAIWPTIKPKLVTSSV